MSNGSIVLVGYFIVINMLTFIYRGVDKWKAVQGGWRVSEKKLLKLVMLGGGLGALMGIQIRRHKTLKGSFLRKVYAAIGVWMVGMYLVLNQ